MDRMERYRELYKNFINIKKQIKETEYTVVNREGEYFGKYKEGRGNNSEARGRDKKPIQ